MRPAGFHALALGHRLRQQHEVRAVAGFELVHALAAELAQEAVGQAVDPAGFGGVQMFAAHGVALENFFDEVGDGLEALTQDGLRNRHWHVLSWPAPTRKKEVDCLATSVFSAPAPAFQCRFSENSTASLPADRNPPRRHSS